MSSAVAAAVIAAAVSVAVAAGSVAVTFVTTRATLRRDHERQAAESPERYGREHGESDDSRVNCPDHRR